MYITHHNYSAVKKFSNFGILAVYVFWGAQKDFCYANDMLHIVTWTKMTGEQSWTKFNFQSSSPIENAAFSLINKDFGFQATYTSTPISITSLVSSFEENNVHYHWRTKRDVICAISTVFSLWMVSSNENSAINEIQLIIVIWCIRMPIIKLKFS